MGILHETGHGLYEQNLPKAWAHWPSGKARGMSLHESQSLFVEKQIGRNPAFWQFALPHLARHLGEDLSIEDLLPHVHLIKRGKIRVDADEVTYPLHVILRYELEQALLSGELEVRDLPEAWDTKMRDYLGISTIGDAKNGPMQDVHWPSGAFGYFPSYTLGAMMAAQQWAAIAMIIPAQMPISRRAILVRSTPGAANAFGTGPRWVRRPKSCVKPPERASIRRISSLIWKPAMGHSRRGPSAPCSCVLSLCIYAGFVLRKGCFFTPAPAFAHQGVEPGGDDDSGA